jgi:hypothetical protein
MNERIKTLMGKTLDSEFSHTWDTMTYEGLLQFSEKFAELIVGECIEQVWYTREDGINGNISQVIKDRIKQNFGVEDV